MLFVVLFTDKQGCGHISAQHLQKHIEWLEANKEVIPLEITSTSGNANSFAYRIQHFHNLSCQRDTRWVLSILQEHSNLEVPHNNASHQQGYKDLPAHQKYQPYKETL